MLTVVIPTIGRTTLQNAIDSVVAEGFKCIVINDGMDTPPPSPQPNLTYLTLGRNFGRLDGTIWYGQIAFTVGVFMCTTEYAMGIGDDDELIPKCGDVIRSTLLAAPEVDIWVPAIEYNNGAIACNTKGILACGNVSHSIYRPRIFATEPMYHHPLDQQSISDWIHVRRCVDAGWKIDWIGHPCVRIRPQLPGTHGRGE